MKQALWGKKALLGKLGSLDLLHSVEEKNFIDLNVACAR